MSDRHRFRADQAARLKQLVRALLVTIVSVGMLLGSFLLSQLEMPDEAAPPTDSFAQESTLTPFLPTFTPQPTLTASPTEAEPTRTPTEEPTVPPTEEPTASPTPAPTPTSPPTKTPVPPAPTPCNPPSDWVSYTVQPDDTLYSIARRFDVERGTIQRANCMRSYTVYAGQALYVPPGAPASPPGGYPAPVLLSPDDGARFPAGAQVPVHWTWEGELGEDEHFDVRFWREGAPHYGAGWSKEGTYALVGDPGVTYYWSVAVIRGQDGKMMEQLSPESPPRKLLWGAAE